MTVRIWGAGPNPSGLCVCGCGQQTPIASTSRRSRGDVRGTPRKFASQGCAARARLHQGIDFETRFWALVDGSGGLSACWPWAGSTSTGYGRFCLSKHVRVSAHRVAFVLAREPIPDALQLDHLCHTHDPSCAGGTTCPHRLCCNPWHLEIVTNRENVLRAHNSPSAVNARKTHCLRGHELAGVNLYTQPDGSRVCRTCRRDRKRQSNSRKVAS